MDNIKQHDIQEGRGMGWHGKTRVNPELSLQNCWLQSWDYLPRIVQVNGKDTPFCVLGVTDVEDLFIGRPYQVKTFKPVLNKQLIAKIEEIIGKQNLPLESCGTVHNRGRLFLSFGLPQAKFNVAGRDFNPYLNIGNGNDMSSPLWFNTSNTCTVCDNTFTINMNEAGLIMSVKKTQFSEIKLAEIGLAIEAAIRGQTAFARTFGQLAGIQCNEKSAREFFAGFVGTPNTALSTRAENTVATLVNLYQHGNGNHGTDYADVFSALTDYYTHIAANSDDDNEAKWKNFVSSEFGSGRNSKIEAWTVLTSEKLRNATVEIGRKVLQLTKKDAKDASQ